MKDKYSCICLWKKKKRTCVKPHLLFWNKISVINQPIRKNRRIEVKYQGDLCLLIDEDNSMWRWSSWSTQLTLYMLPTCFLLTVPTPHNQKKRRQHQCQGKESKGDDWTKPTWPALIEDPSVAWITNDEIWWTLLNKRWDPREV